MSGPEAQHSGPSIGGRTTLVSNVTGWRVYPRPLRPIGARIRCRRAARSPFDRLGAWRVWRWREREWPDWHPRCTSPGQVTKWSWWSVTTRHCPTIPPTRSGGTGAARRRSVTPTPSWRDCGTSSWPTTPTCSPRCSRRGPPRWTSSRCCPRAWTALRCPGTNSSSPWHAGERPSSGCCGGRCCPNPPRNCATASPCRTCAVGPGNEGSEPARTERPS